MGTVPIYREEKFHRHRLQSYEVLALKKPCTSAALKTYFSPTLQMFQVFAYVFEFAYLCASVLLTLCVIVGCYLFVYILA